MTVNPTPQASEPARPSAPGALVAHACLLALVEALILSLLLPLPGPRAMFARRMMLRRVRAMAIAFAPDAPAHAPAVALGLIPDWILPGYRNRGMRRTAEACPHAGITESARAPPFGSAVPTRKNTLQPEGALPRPYSFRYKNYSEIRRRVAISPITPRRNAITHRMKIAPCVTVTQAPNGAR